MRGLSLAFGVAMVAAAEPPPHWPALCTAGLAIAAVFLGVRFRSAATVAVLLTVLTLALSAPSPMLAVLSGLCATAYLVLRHASGRTAMASSRVTTVAAAGFGLAGVAVTVVPLEVAWLPVVAPFALLGAFALTLYPYLRQQNSDSATATT